MSERVVRDATYLIMWRVKWPGGSLSDMVNLSRANDAAARFNETMEREQRGRQRPLEAGRRVSRPTGTRTATGGNHEF